ncbi:MAG TPA: hypothetical protein VGF75_08265 [Candidatus Saccharimonadales bacterium]|jgi:hypothetical protein
MTYKEFQKYRRSKRGDPNKLSCNNHGPNRSFAAPSARKAPINTKSGHGDVLSGLFHSEARASYKTVGNPLNNGKVVTKELELSRLTFQDLLERHHFTKNNGFWA